jgi:N utilization substance protein B
MGARHSGREAALQMLFQIEASGVSTDEAIRLFWRTFLGDADPEGRSYADEAVRGVASVREELDRYVAEASAHWRIERMARVDRNVLRLGTWELAHRPDVPRAVVLDEAVELAKSFGTDESSAFVNGVLNRIADTLGRQDPPSPEEPRPEETPEER